jgi:AcrR family transcriptional regulator
MRHAALAKRPPVTARGQRTRARLLEAAEKVFAEAGYAEASIAEITRGAGIGLGTFYVYFPNKEVLFLELVDDLGARLKQFVSQRMAQHTGRIERQRASFRAFLEFTAKHRYLYRVVRQAELVDPGAFQGYYEKLANNWADGLKQAMNEDDFASYDAEALAWVLMGVAHFVGLRYVVWRETPEFERVLDDVLDFVEAGLKTPRKPRALAKAG